METWKVKTLGCDNDAGRFELGGCFMSMIEGSNLVRGANVLDIDSAVETEIKDIYDVGNIVVAQPRDGLRVYSMTADGVAIVLVAERQEVVS